MKSLPMFVRHHQWPHLFSIGAAVSCATTTTPLPPGSQAFAPPSVYQLWWSMTEACSGRTAQSSLVSWYIVPGTSELPFASDQVEGYWIQQGDRIVLAGGAQFDGQLVRHEMLHAILGPGQGRHSRQQFLQRCGGVVACEEICLRDAGPPASPGSQVATVSPDSIDITARMIPEFPSASQYGGYFSLIVMARNPRADSVIVALPLASSTSGGVAFGYHVSGEGLLVTYSDVASDVAVRFFGPGEMKQYAFDFQIGAPETRRGGLPKGQFDVWGTFGGHIASSPMHLTLQE